MSENKELLEATIKGLEEKMNQLNSDLRSKERELADVNKPEMTGEMFDNITELVEEAVDNVNIESDDLSSYEIDGLESLLNYCETMFFMKEEIEGILTLYKEEENG